MRTRLGDCRAHTELYPIFAERKKLCFFDEVRRKCEATDPCCPADEHASVTVWCLSARWVAGATSGPNSGSPRGPLLKVNPEMAHTGFTEGVTVGRDLTLGKQLQCLLQGLRSAFRSAWRPRIGTA